MCRAIILQNMCVKEREEFCMESEKAETEDALVGGGVPAM